jgi:hypothetical protein
VSALEQMMRGPAGVLRLQGALAMMAWQAAFVVPLRLQALALGSLSRPGDATEAARMVTEKLAAAAAGTGAATLRALRGGDAVSVAMAAISPTRRTLRANARRLAAGSHIFR